MGLETADHVRKALLDQSTSDGFIFYAGKVPDGHYRPDLVPLGPVKYFFYRKSAFARIASQIKKSDVCGRLELKIADQARRAIFGQSASE